MANYRTGADIIRDVLFRASELTSGSSDFNAQVIVAVNRAWQAIWSGGGELLPTVHEDWEWLRKDPPGVLTLLPAYGNNTADGFAAIMNGSNSVTLDTTPASLQGRFIRFGDHPDVFRVLSHDDFSASIVLDSIYTGPTNAASPFVAVKMLYDLASDVLTVISPMRVFQETSDRIDGMDLTSLERDWPTRIFQFGVPAAFAPVGERRVRFSHYGFDDPTRLIRVEYEYMFQPDDIANDTVEPPIPFKHRRVIADFGLFFILSDKNDNRAETVGQLAKSGLEAMARENRAEQVRRDPHFGRVFPRGGPQVKIGPLRTEGGFIIG